MLIFNFLMLQNDSGDAVVEEMKACVFAPLRPLCFPRCYMQLFLALVLEKAWISGYCPKQLFKMENHFVYER